MEPRVTKRDKRLHLSYELPHRIHCSQIYPVPAPNGSTLIIYGHEGGVRVLWRGGRRRRATPPQTNGTSTRHHIITINDSDDEKATSTARAAADEYEDEEDEQDPDCPYPSIVSDLDIGLDGAALHLAVPSIPASHPPKLARSHAIVTAACANGRVVALAIPLSPPRDDNNNPRGLSQVNLPPLRQPPHSLSAKLLVLSRDDSTQARSRSRSRAPDAELVVAAVSSTLSVCGIDVTGSAIKKRPDASVCSVSLAVPGSSISFHPSSKSTQLLVSDASGAVRLYDPFDSETPDGHVAGKWLMSYLSPLQTASTSIHALAHRKRVLDCAWILAGRGILALLEDGEWGIWDISGSIQTQKSVNNFAISGFLGTAGGEAAEPARSKKGSSKLAPMTPNTRKQKSDSLFGSTSKVAGHAPTGGISIAQAPSKHAQVGESVTLWYCGQVYSIPSMQQFWQRSTGTTGANSFGSLYAPGMTHVSDINLMNENITSISQFDNTTNLSSFGQMNMQRDLLVSAEHRLAILQSNRPAAGPSRQLFQQASERPIERERDQHMLDAGDLDLGGLNRMLDSRAEDTRPRRVGFAH